MTTLLAKKSIKKELAPGKKAQPLPDLYDKNPYTAIRNGKVMAKAWSKTLKEEDYSQYAQTFVFKTIEAYWQKVQDGKSQMALPFLLKKFILKKLDNSVLAVAEAIGAAAGKLAVIEASYELGNVYTALLPEMIRATSGVFYTPPSLTRRLIKVAEEAGVEWATAKVIDPACGGGAFLAPVCSKILDALRGQNPLKILAHIQSHLVGWEIDPFGGWLSQVFVEVVTKDIQQQAGIRLRPLVTIVDSLKADLLPATKRFDLVIGNPPYGKLKLTDQIRKNYQQSLYGHPNFYGLFTHLALNLVKEKGIVAYLTPTSFLSGEYFKNLRLLLRQESTPLEIDFVSFRKGVFEDVLQETMLTVYRKQTNVTANVKVNQLTTVPEKELTILPIGQFGLPFDLSSPWVLPRTLKQATIVQAMKNLTARLKDWGYLVSTGPLVWNRHKPQLSKKEGKGKYPIVWAEAITSDGTFILRAEKKNHQPFCTIKKGDEWLMTTKPCILLQRTTSKEQDKRLIAAALPAELLEQKKGVVIENHLNMIIAQDISPRVAPAVLAAFLNSKATNEAFRTISGSVAVSAYELESLPLPPIDKLGELSQLIQEQKDQVAIENACLQLYKV